MNDRKRAYEYENGAYKYWKPCWWEPQLKPCPFCGGEAMYHDDGMNGWIQCCDVRTLGSYSWRDKDWQATEAECWNTRYDDRT